MGSNLLKFIAKRNIEIALGPSSEQSGSPIPRYDVSLKNGEKEASFVIFGQAESERQMTPEDAFRALFIRVRFHESNAALSSGFDTLCRDTARRLKEILGPDNYSDLLSCF